MSTSKTYVVGDSGSVRRLDNLALPWLDVPITNSYPVTSGFRMNDVMTDPLDQNKVYVVGQGRSGTGAFGIYVSVDGGFNWLIPAGDYQTNFADPAVPMEWHEVWVVNSNTIVVCGEYGYCAVSNDGGTTFTLTNQMPNVEELIGEDPDLPTAYSTHWLSPTAGVVGTRGNVLKTIDGGTNWAVLNGGVRLGSADYIRGIHISSDNQTIVALAQNAIYRSTDAGASFGIVYNFPLDADTGEGTGRHLTWINDLELWAVGMGGIRAKSTDGGATWTTLSAYSTQAKDHYAAHLWNNLDGFYGYSEEVIRSSDSLVGGAVSDTWVGGLLPRAVWTNYLPTTCYFLRSCDGSVGPIYVDNDLSDIVGQVITLCPEDIDDPEGGPVGQTTASTARQAAQPQPGLGTPIIINPNDPGTSEFWLSSCCGGVGGYFKVSNNLGAYVGLSVVIPSIDPDVCFNVSATGNVVALNLGLVNLTNGVYFTTCNECTSTYPCALPSPVLTECACFIVEEAYECFEPITLNRVPNAVPTCDDCVPEYCYYLVDCQDPTNFLITDNDLSLYVGKTVHLESTGDTCWSVLNAPNCDGATDISPVVAEFTNCSDCLPDEEEVPLTLKTRSVFPGYDTPGCPPEYFEEVNCRYADQYYQQMVGVRYGLEVCCREDIEQWTIKKRLLDLKVLFDPDFCTTTDDCCTPECVDATINVFNPVSCPEPEEVSALLEYPTPCVEPEDVVAILDIFDPPTCQCYQISNIIADENLVEAAPGGSSTVQYIPCQAEGISTLVLLPGQVAFHCSEIPPVVVNGFATVTLLPARDCLSGLCP